MAQNPIFGVNVIGRTTFHVTTFHVPSVGPTWLGWSICPVGLVELLGDPPVGPSPEDSPGEFRSGTSLGPLLWVIRPRGMGYGGKAS